MRLLDEAIAYEVGERAIPSISYALFSATETLQHAHVTAPGATPLGPETLFRIASISKTFAGLAALREVEAGRLDLDADVSRTIGAFRPTWQGRPALVTLRGLLSHRSGLTREAGRGHYLTAERATLAASVDSLRASPLKAKPDGQSYRYSNAGFAVVGGAVEASSGRDYANYLRDAVLGPLGLADTAMSLDASQRARLAPAIIWGAEGDRAAPVFNLGCAPAGNIVASLEDMVAYGQALLLPTNPIVSAATLETMWQPAGGGETGYGLGFAVDRLDGHRTVGHGGAIYGYATQLLLMPYAGLGIFMVATADATGELVGRLGRYALRLALAARGLAPIPPPPRRLPRCSPKLAERLAGTYLADDRRTIELQNTLGGLMLIDRLVPLELRPFGSAQFAIDGRLYGEGTAFSGPLVETEGDALGWAGQVWRRSAAGAEHAPPSLAAHLGRYAPDFLPTELIVSGGQLVCVIEGLFPHPCEPLGDNCFRMGKGMYEDELLELDVTDAAGRPAIRVGGMVLEKSSS